LFQPNDIPHPRTLVSSLQLFWIWVPTQRFLERKHILTVLIGPRNRWVGPEPEHRWVNQGLENSSLALILWLVIDYPLYYVL
jgi:hypothetical protein